MNIVRWYPFGGLSKISEINRLFELPLHHHHFGLRLWGDSWTPPVDMYRTPEAVVVKVSLPGIRQEDVEISVTGDTLTIKGEVKANEEIKEEDYLVREGLNGSFSRFVDLPSGLQVDKAEAVFENGVLLLTIPKVEEVRPKSIKVKAKNIVEAKA